MTNESNTSKPFADLELFLFSLREITNLPEEQKYAKVFKTMTTFFTMVKVDHNMLANIGLDLLISSALTETNGDLKEAKQAIKEQMLPWLVEKIDLIQNITVVDTPEAKNTNLDVDLHNQDGKLH